MRHRWTDQFPYVCQRCGWVYHAGQDMDECKDPFRARSRVVRKALGGPYAGKVS